MAARRSLGIFSSAVIAAGLVAPAATAHSPDPALGGALWARSQLVLYDWRSGQVPPAWMQEAIDAAAADSNVSRRAKAARFRYDATDGTSPIAYGEPTGCSSQGIACFSRVGAPNSFAMWFRRQGHVFDWGALRWCQAYEDPPDGCFDVENIALDEFGHIEGLGHHDNFADNSDFLDAVVQTYSRAKPRLGWNVHEYGRCDVATLQRLYDVLTWATDYSTCLDLITAVSLTPSATAVPYRGVVSFDSRLWVTTDDEYGALAGNPLADRTVRLQRRPVGGTTWTTIATMTSDGTGGYSVDLSLTATAEYRARFSEPLDEGLRGDTSAVYTVIVGTCNSGCPTGVR